MSFADFKLGQLNPIFWNSDLNKTKTTEPKKENAIDLTDGIYQPSSDVEAIDSELADIMAELGMEDESETVAGTLEDINAGEEAVAGTLDIVNNELVNGSEATEGTSMSDEAKEAIKAKMEALQEEYDKEVEKMEQIKEDIEELSDKVAENITKAAAAQEQAVKENEEQAQAVVDEQLKAYIEANQEGGEGMTREQLQENIKGAMPDAPNVSAALAAAIEANEQISEIDALLGELNTLTAKVKPMEDQLNAYADILDADDAAKEAEGANGENGGKKCCDPIGFEANGQEFNFFTDKDNDGALSQTNEFLGADKQWEEMTAADVDGNGTVTAEELEAKGIQMAGKDGTIIKGADAYKEAFGENFSINLNSYDENGTYAGIDTTKDTDADGTVDQELLGTFNVNVNGEEIQGYNTLDDVDWLSENYGVEISETSGAEGAEEAEEAAKTLKFDNVQGFIDFAEMAAEQNELAKEELAAIEESLGFNTDTVAQYKEVVAQQATGLVSEYVKSLGEDENDDATALGSDIDADATAEEQEIKAAEDTTTNETQTEEELREELEEEAIAA